MVNWNPDTIIPQSMYLKHCSLNGNDIEAINQAVEAMAALAEFIAARHIDCPALDGIEDHPEQLVDLSIRLEGIPATTLNCSSN